MIELSPSEYPVDRVISERDGWSYAGGTSYMQAALIPNLPVAEIQGLHDSGLSTDEDGETIADVDDPEIPWGWRVIEADDMSLFLPEEVL